MNDIVVMDVRYDKFSCILLYDYIFTGTLINTYYVDIIIKKSLKNILQKEETGNQIIRAN